MTDNKPKPNQRWGILGGSFDPIHNGHLHLASELQKHLNLDGILWVLAVRHPIKAETVATSFEERWHMLRLALAAYPDYLLSDIEKTNNLSGYTVDTVKAIIGTYPSVEFYFLIGADNVRELTKWKQPEEITKLVTLVAGNRPGSVIELKRLPHAIPVTYIPTEELDVSSTTIRHAIKTGAGNSIKEQLPDEVYEYILQRKLYR